MAGPIVAPASASLWPITDALALPAAHSPSIGVRSAGHVTSGRARGELLGFVAVRRSGLQAGAPLFLDVAVAPDEQGGEPGGDEHGHDHESGRVEVEAGHEAPEAAGLAE